MAEALKHLVDARVVRWMAKDLEAAAARAKLGRHFDAKAFAREAVRGLDALELLARGWHVAEALHAHLPSPFARGGRVVLAALEGAPPRDEGPAGLSVFRWLPHAFYLQKYGLAETDFDLAMRLQRAVTKQFTAEFSLRPFLERHPEATYARLVAWSTDEDVHVRRLVSEGTRPRLPWAPRLKRYQADPRPVLALLERLVDDPEDYVRRSVANALNDVSKDHPDLAVSVAARWAKDAPPGRAWVVRHALRVLVKQGHPGALAVLGAGEAPEVRVERARVTPREVVRGGEVRVTFELVGTSARAQRLVVDWAVHYVKANGSTSPKVFKLTKLELAPGARVALGCRVVFRDLSTRKHHPGRHGLELRVNGVAFPLGSVVLRDGE